RSQHVVGEDPASRSFATYLSLHVAVSAEKIFRDTARAATMREQPLLHRLRIRFKRQRAMLAPFTLFDPAIAAWFEVCTHAQDALGSMRDAVLFAERAKVVGAVHLARVLREEAAGHFSGFLDAWSNADATHRPILQAACDALARAARTAAGPEVATAPTAESATSAAPSHALPTEIERKFLLHGLPPTAAVAPSIRIEQGWLPGTVLRERLRSATATDGTTVHTRTIKLGAMGARIEVEEPTTPALFDALWPLTADARIRKRRHLVPHNGKTWEIDVFLDRDLVLAELELESESEEVTLPDWLAPFVIKEVTHDPAYLNSVMAQRDVASPDRARRGDHEWLRAI
ncbi:MAG: CHAD domain-containing protein, partial [Gemmatimonadaceae bacterium]|nr:CHAD domain-containing protein [Gemmatimonadaceae bacterium]